MVLIDFLKSDLEKICPGGFSGFIRWYLFPHGEMYRYTFWFRITWYLKRKYKSIPVIWALPYLFMRHYEFKYGVHVNTNIDIGKGLHIVHGDGVYLNCRRIGDNFKVFQGVTLGVGRNGIPEIGNDVVIYTNAVVVGGISIGDGAVVGANAFVNMDVGKGEIFVGNPAHFLKKM